MGTVDADMIHVAARHHTIIKEGETTHLGDRPRDAAIRPVVVSTHDLGPQSIVATLETRVPLVATEAR
jgi:hypothetical protein